MTGVFGAIFGLSSVVGPSLGGLLTGRARLALGVLRQTFPSAWVATILVRDAAPRVCGPQARLRDIDFAGNGSAPRRPSPRC